MKIYKLFFLLVFVPGILFPQSGVLRGTLLDQNTRLPVSNAHLKVRNSTQGTVTGPGGTFSLAIGALPATVDFSCIGYESITLEITSIDVRPRTFYLKPRTYQLEPVTISGQPAVVIYKDEDYSVLDFDFLDDNLLLVVFRYQLKRAEIILMTTAGDTLAVTHVPAVPARCLYRDVLSNIHYITTRDEAFQAVYDPVFNQLDFPFRTSYDTIIKFLGGYRFLLGSRLWFQEDSPDGFMTAIGYYSRSEGRRNIHRSADLKAMKTYYNEAWYYHTDRAVPDPIDENERRSLDTDAIRYKYFFWDKGCGELFKVSDTLMAFFNFCENRIELLDTTGQTKRVTSIGFHLERPERFITSLTGSFAGTSDWNWNHSLVQDARFQDIYAVFTNKGFLRLERVDLLTGSLARSAELPYEFPEKVKIFKGEAYFLYRGGGEHDNRKLYKMALK
ncbi:MAG: carboxypeptidase-like regulatory domain-containing protein [Bacteroidetes bacterium]|nr:carboxypeptidase-like regulatory domain-containing protein [Bacteroidota bacterium]